MFRNIFIASALLVASGTALAAQDATAEPAVTAPSAEETAWNDVKDSDVSADVYDFIQTYPNGTFAKEAKARMIDLLWVEVATATAPAEEAPEERAFTPVLFSTPLTEGTPEIVGKSIEELIKGTPTFAPVEGLPEELWKAQECSSCHIWEQANLCDQAKTYLTDAGAENLTKEHPYGGTFKQNLRNWGFGGCE